VDETQQEKLIFFYIFFSVIAVRLFYWVWVFPSFIQSLFSVTDSPNHQSTGFWCVSKETWSTSPRCPQTVFFTNISERACFNVLGNDSYSVRQWSPMFEKPINYLCILSWKVGAFLTFCSSCRQQVIASSILMVYIRFCREFKASSFGGKMEYLARKVNEIIQK
jgi:hypothetical protein